MAQENRRLHRITEPVASGPSAALRASPFAYALGKKVRKIRGKIKNVGAPTFLRGGTLPRFCVSRGNKGHTRLMFVSRGNKGDSPPPLKLRRGTPLTHETEGGDEQAGGHPPFFAGTSGRRRGEPGGPVFEQMTSPQRGRKT